MTGPRILLVDNYDSFTFNLYQSLAVATQTSPIVVRNDDDYDRVKGLEYDAIVISPGPGKPSIERDFGICGRLIKEASVPVLGVCLGHQGIASVFGGKVGHSPEPMHGRASAMNHNGDPLFKEIEHCFEAVRYHSLIVEELPPCLVGIAWTEEDGLLMGLRHKSRPIWGVQFHPESIGTAPGHQLIMNFVSLVCPGFIAGRFSSSDNVPFVAASSGSDWVVKVKPLPSWVAPETVFTALYGKREKVFWLDSTAHDPELSRFSYMGDASGPCAELITYSVHDRSLCLDTPHGAHELPCNFFEYFADRLSELRVESAECPAPFVGGWVGFLGYELKAETEGSLVHTADTPDAAFMFCDRVLIFDHLEAQIYAVDLSRGGHSQFTWFQDILELTTETTSPGSIEPNHFELSRSTSVYLSDIERCLGLIAEGETYEVCLTAHLVGEPVRDPLDMYRALRRLHKVPFGAYLRFGDLHLASISPERFLRVTRDGVVEAKPIKGTAARGATIEDDRAAAEELKNSTKDRAENLMIVDLLRNDLGQVCQVGSVHVPRLMEVESYGVHQLVSTIRGLLREDCQALDAVKACFPGGSMTGAPKRRTMEIIDQLETEARGPYSGALGYFSATGDIDLSIVIRTAVMTADRTRVGVGGAVVALSDPEAELAEVFLKGRTVTTVFGTED